MPWNNLHFISINPRHYSVHYNRDIIYLDHILHEISYIERICKGRSINDLYTDEDLQHMVSGAFEIIGEAAKNISLSCKNRYPDIP